MENILLYWIFSFSLQRTAQVIDYNQLQMYKKKLGTETFCSIIIKYSK